MTDIPTRSADRIREELEQAIIAGEFVNGERLDEVSLAERFSVSRTPVREALLALGASDLVEQLPRRGTFVRHPSFIRLIEMFDVMAELEAMCGRLAARRLTEDDLAAIRAAQEDCRVAAKKNDTDLYYRENERFHHLLYRASGNDFLAAEALRLQKRLRPFRRLQLRVRHRMDQSMGEHDAIIAAIERGESARSSSLLRAHIAIQGEKFSDLMASHDARKLAVAS